MVTTVPNRLRDFLRDEHLPRARTTVGLGTLPGGADWYAARAAASTTTDLAPAAIHALGKQEVQLKDGQRKITELQDKLDSLADIERTLTPRPRAVRHEGGRP